MVGAALRIGSTPHQALLKVLSFGGLCTSAESLAELETVLNRKKFDRYLDREERRKFIDNISRRSRLFVVQSASTLGIVPPCRDPSDNHLLALALAAEADAVISSDEDLLVLHPLRGIPILTTAGFLAENSPTRS